MSWPSPSSRRAWLAVGGLAAAALGAAAFGIRMATGPDGYEPYPKFMLRDVNGRGVPLTAAQQQQALAIALADPRVQRAIAGRRTGEPVVGDWLYRQYLIGADVRIPFDDAQTIDGEWVTLQQSAGVAGPGRQIFPSLAFRQTICGVEQLLIQIEWKSQEVAVLVPDAAPTLIVVGTPAPDLEAEREAWEERYGPIAKAED